MEVEVPQRRPVAEGPSEVVEQLERVERLEQVEQLEQLEQLVLPEEVGLCRLSPAPSLEAHAQISAVSQGCEALKQKASCTTDEKMERKNRGREIREDFDLTH